MSIEKTPAKNEVLFTWFNRYSGVTVRTPSKTLIFDPVDVKPRNFGKIDALFVSHEHYDHLDQALVSEICKLTQCTVVADPTSARRLRNIIPDHLLQGVQVGSETRVGDVLVKTEMSNHPPATSPVTFVVTSEDGVKLFHTADSMPYPEMVTIGEREKLDLVFCTIGIATNASPETGIDIARLTKAKVAVPYHTGSSGDLKKFADLLRKDLPQTTCLVPEIGKIYQVSKRK